MEYNRIEKLILKLAWSHALDSDQMEELVAVGNLAFVKGMKKFNGNSATKTTYLYRVINNAMIDHLRKQNNFNLHICFKDVEIRCGYNRRMKFFDALVDLSWETKCMVKDLLSDPDQLFKRARYSGKRWMKYAFKQLMRDYGYKQEQINISMEEITNFLKGV